MIHAYCQQDWETAHYCPWQLSEYLNKVIIITSSLYMLYFLNHMPLLNSCQIQYRNHIIGSFECNKHALEQLYTELLTLQAYNISYWSPLCTSSKIKTYILRVRVQTPMSVRSRCCTQNAIYQCFIYLSECRDWFRHGAMRLPSACCFLQSTYTHNAFHLRLHILGYRLGTCEVCSCWQNA